MGLLRATLLLASTAFIGECIEFFINLVLAKYLGEYWLGKYMSILPIIGFVAILASLELDIAVSKFVAEREEEAHYSIIHIAGQMGFLFILCLIVLGTVLFLVFPVFSEIHFLVRWLILFLIPLVLLSSIIRGYFIGVQRMGKIAIANLLSKAMQLFLLLLFFQFFVVPLEISILFAIFAIIGAEILALVYLLSTFLLQLRKLKSLKGIRQYNKSTLMRELLSISIPTASMRIFNSLVNAIKPFYIQGVLIASGLSALEATEQFGIITGVVFSIGFFPAFIAHSFMVVLIPNVASAYRSGDRGKLIRLLRQVILLTSLYGIPVCVFFYSFAEPLTRLFVSSPVAPYYLQLMWPYFLLHYFTFPLQAFLIALGLVKDVFLHNIWEAVVIFTLIWLFGVNPAFQMDGVIIGLNTGALLVMLLHYLTVCKKIGIPATLTWQKMHDER